MNKAHRIGQIATLLVAVAGVIVSILLLLIHVRTVAGDLSGVAQLCGADGRFDCSQAAASGWSTVLGVPIAALGLGFYLAVVVTAALGGLAEWRSDASRPGANVAGIVHIGFILSVLYSVFLAYVNLTQLEKSCDKCMMLYAVNLVGLVTSAAWTSGRARVVALESFRGLGASLPTLPAGVLVLTALVAIGGSVWQSNQIKAEAAQDAPAPELEGRAVDAELLRAAHAPSVGPADAAVVIVEFSDFECPFCARFAAMVDVLKSEFPTELRVEFRHFPLTMHPNARIAARATVCAQELGRFWELHDAVFQNQRNLTRESVLRLAGRLDLNEDELADCMDSDFAESRVQQDRAAGEALGIRGTPTLFINGRRYAGRLELNDLRTIIRSQL